MLEDSTYCWAVGEMEVAGVLKVSFPSPAMFLLHLRSVQVRSPTLPSEALRVD